MCALILIEKYNIHRYTDIVAATQWCRSGLVELTPHLRSGWEELPHAQGQWRDQEELPHIQYQEQWLRFAGAAVKRYPTSKVRENKVRW